VVFLCTSPNNSQDATLKFATVASFQTLLLTIYDIPVPFDTADETVSFKKLSISSICETVMHPKSGSVLYMV
jgi:hypothetical protein